MTGNDAKIVSVFGVSGKEYQTYGYAADATVISARTLHEYSGEYQDYTITPETGQDSFFQIDYGREYLRAIDMSDQDVTDITIPDDDNIRLEYVDLSDNAITSEASLIALIDHCYDTGVNDGEMDISGGTNADICDPTALAQISDMVNTRGWTITYNNSCGGIYDVSDPQTTYVSLDNSYGDISGSFIGNELISPVDGSCPTETAMGQSVASYDPGGGVVTYWVFIGFAQLTCADYTQVSVSVGTNDTYDVDSIDGTFYNKFIIDLPHATLNQQITGAPLAILHGGTHDGLNVAVGATVADGGKTKVTLTDGGAITTPDYTSVTIYGWNQ